MACHAQTEGDTKFDAIAAWNRRPPPNASEGSLVPLDVDALKEIIHASLAPWGISENILYGTVDAIVAKFGLPASEGELYVKCENCRGTGIVDSVAHSIEHRVEQCDCILCDGTGFIPASPSPRAVLSEEVLEAASYLRLRIARGSYAVKTMNAIIALISALENKPPLSEEVAELLEKLRTYLDNNDLLDLTDAEIRTLISALENKP